jgi:hypothetical protein
MSLVLNYRFMTVRNLGVSGIIKNGGGGSYITLDNTMEPTGEELYLDNVTIADSDNIVGEGTTCYRVKRLDSQQWDCVVKFKWRPTSKRPEEGLVHLAKERNVRGVVSIEYDRIIDSTDNMRQGLLFGPYRMLLADQHSAGKPDIGGMVQNTEESSRKFENRMFTCIVVSPAGRPLTTFKDRLGLLQALRDAIKAHRSLFQDANIRHQDVSVNNIIIVEPQCEGDPRGTLIDLDVAMDLAIGPRPPNEVVFNRAFMAIGILERRPHTYRHDLKSFLYVLLRAVLCDTDQNLPSTSRLRQWNQGTWDESAEIRTHDMDHDHFANLVLSEFPPQFHSLKPLAEEFRRILFPIVDGKVWTGTYGQAAVINNIYDGIIAAFEKAIVSEEASA